MPLIQVTIQTTMEIDTDTYIAAAVEEEERHEGELDPTDYQDVAAAAVSYCDPEDRMPRWARHCLTITYHNVAVTRVQESAV